MHQPLSITQEPPSCFWASPVFGPPPPLGGLCCYLFPPFVHPPPTLVSHPCLSSCARLLSHSFWRSVNCCGPHRPVQGSHPHQGGLRCQLCVFNTEVTAFPGAASPPIPLWLAHMAWNLFCDLRVDVLGRCGTFFSYDFGLLRTGSSSAVHSGSLDSLHSSPGTSSSSAWALSLRWNRLKPLGPSGPTIAPQNHAARLLGRGGGF